MANPPPGEEAIQEIQEQIVLDTPVLDRLQQSSLPFRGSFRERALERVRYRIKQRRTAEGFALRASNLVSGPVAQAVDEEMRYVVQENVQRILERRLEDR